MRNIHVLALALFAVLAFGSVIATSAFAEEAEESELLISGAVAVAGQLLDAEGELLLEDTKGGIFGEAVKILCSFLTLAEVLTSTDIDITTIYALGAADPETLGSAKIPCTTQAGICSEPTASAVHLNWLVEIKPEGTTPSLLYSEGEGGNPGWAVECNKVAEDECTGKTAVEFKNETNGTIDTEFNAATLTPENCTRGGTGAGLIEGLVVFLSVEAGLSLQIPVITGQLKRSGMGILSVPLGAKAEETITYETIGTLLNSGIMRVSVASESVFVVAPPTEKPCNAKTILKGETCLVAIECRNSATDGNQGTAVVLSEMALVSKAEWTVECK